MSASQRGLVDQTFGSISRQNRLRRANLLPDSESAQKNWTIEIKLLLTFRPKTMIVGIVTGPFKDSYGVQKVHDWTKKWDLFFK